MQNVLDELRWPEADHARNWLSSSEQLVDTENGDAVLDFVYGYLWGEALRFGDD